MKYFLIAGEASGDLHASNLMREIEAKDAKADFRYLGGDLMQAQGGTLVKHYREMAFMGFVMVALHLRTVLRNIEDCKKSVAEYQPDVLILIDYPSFNLRIAEFVKKTMPGIPVFYYISPKIWAWKEFRIKSIKKYIDKMFTILPFETEFYKKHNYPVTYVGNPCLDAVYFREHKNESSEDFIERTGLPDSKRFVALLAGSREQEIRGCLPTMIKMAERFKQYQFVVAGAPSSDKNIYNEIIKNTDVKIVYGETYELLQQSCAAVVNSGTATLETALLRTPQVVVYHVFGGFLANLIKPIVLKIKYVSLVNLIAGKEVVKELLAANFTAKNVERELSPLLSDTPRRKKMLEEYDNLIASLGKPNVAKEAAEKIIDLLHNEFNKE